MKHKIRLILEDYIHRARPFRMLPIRILKKLGLLRFINIVIPINYAGKRFKIPIRGGDGIPLLRLSLHEPWLLKVFDRIEVETDGSFIDIGVNLGQTLLKVQRYYPELSYIGFEPNPHCCAYVDRLMELNGFERVRIIPCAISNSSGVSQFVNKGRLGTRGALINSASSVKEMFDRTTTVVSIAGDEISESVLVNPIKIIKIDVEGSELYVVKGLLQTIRAHKPYIIVEILPPSYAHGVATSEYEEAVDRAIELLAILHDLGYSGARIRRDGELVGIEQTNVDQQGLDLSYDYLFWGDWHTGMSVR